MLLQKTSSMLKNYLSLRRGNSGDDYHDVLANNDRLFNRRLKTQSWIAQTPASGSSALRRTVSSIQIPPPHLSPSISPKIASARSSESSVCSCCEDSMTVPRASHSLSKTTSTMKSTPIILCLEPEASPTGDAQTWSQIFADPDNELLDPDEPPALSPGIQIPVLPHITDGSTFDLLEALRLGPDGDKTPKQESQGMTEQPGEDWSDDVEQLIRETDAAFKAVGFALADAETESGIPTEFYSANSTVATAMPNLKMGLRKQSKPTLSRNASVSKSIRRPKNRTTNSVTNSPGIIQIVQQASSTSTQKLKQAPRWTLTEVTDNVADIFKFKTIEVDEMLTPDRIMQQKLGAALKEVQIRQTAREAAKRMSVATNKSTSADEASTPVEPFHLQDLPTRIGAALVSQTPPPISPSSFDVSRHVPPPSPSAPPIPERNKRRSVATTTTVPDSKEASSPMSSDGGLDNQPLEVRGVSFPSPPTNSPPRLLQPPSRVRASPIRRVASELPTIDETLPMPPTPPMPRSSGIPKPQSPRQPTARAKSRPDLNVTDLPMTPKSNLNRQKLRRGPSGQAGRPRPNKRSASKRLNLATVPNAPPSSFIPQIPVSQLTSTPYTLTAPFFRHGAIRLIPSSNTLLSLPLPGHRSPQSPLFAPTSASDSDASLNYGSKAYRRYTNGGARGTKRRRRGTGRKQPGSDGDDSPSRANLDWTAFQMAISGGTGDLSQSGPMSYFVLGEGGLAVDKSNTTGDVDVEEMRDWWDGFGFGGIGVEDGLGVVNGIVPGMGRMVYNVGNGSEAEENNTVVSEGVAATKTVGLAFAKREYSLRGQIDSHSGKGLRSHDQRQRPDSPQLASNIPFSLRVGYINTPQRQAAYRRRNWGAIEEGGEVESQNLAYDFDGPDDFDKLRSGSGGSRFGPGQSFSRGGVSRESDGDEDESMPPSPTMRFPPVAGGHFDVVPMGFNLTHDIGDFLGWEARHFEQK